MLTVLTLSVTAKANQSPARIDHNAFYYSPTQGIIFNDNLSDKLAADIRFKELINLGISFGNKVRSLSTEDKKMILAYSKEQNGQKLLELFTKCNIDIKSYSSARVSLITGINNDYGLDKRSDKQQIIRAAVAKLDPPTFAECLAFWSNDSQLCYLLWSGDDNMYLWCMSIMFATYVACLGAM